MPLVNCPDCGKQVSDRVEACPFCGCPAKFFTNHDLESVIRNSDVSVDKYITFTFGNEIIRYPEGSEKFAALFGIYKSAAIQGIDLAKDIYKSAGGIEKALEMLPEYMSELIVGIINSCTKTMYNAGIIMTPEQFFDKYVDKYDIDYCDFYEVIVIKYEEILAESDRRGNRREFDKATRARWEGGGFGFKGAVKGAMEATVMNVASDFWHSFGDSAREREDYQVIQGLLDDLYKSDIAVESLILSVDEIIMNIFSALVDELIAVKYFDKIIELDKEQARSLIETTTLYEKNAARAFTNYIKSISLYPGYLEAYDDFFWNFLSSLESNQIKEFTDFWNIPYVYEKYRLYMKDAGNHLSLSDVDDEGLDEEDSERFSNAFIDGISLSKNEKYMGNVINKPFSDVEGVIDLRYNKMDERKVSALRRQKVLYYSPGIIVTDKMLVWDDVCLHIGCIGEINIVEQDNETKVIIEDINDDVPYICSSHGHGKDFVLIFSRASDKVYIGDDDFGKELVLSEDIQYFLSEIRNIPALKDCERCIRACDVVEPEIYDRLGTSYGEDPNQIVLLLCEEIMITSTAIFVGDEKINLENIANVTVEDRSWVFDVYNGLYKRIRLGNTIPDLARIVNKFIWKKKIGILKEKFNSNSLFKKYDIDNFDFTSIDIQNVIHLRRFILEYEEASGKLFSTNKEFDEYAKKYFRKFINEHPQKANSVEMAAWIPKEYGLEDYLRIASTDLYLRNSIIDVVWTSGRKIEKKDPNSLEGKYSGFDESYQSLGGNSKIKENNAKVLIYYDNSFLSTGKKGFALTTKYFWDLKTLQKIALEDINEIACEMKGNKPNLVVKGAGKIIMISDSNVAFPDADYKDRVEGFANQLKLILCRFFGNVHFNIPGEKIKQSLSDKLKKDKDVYDWRSASFDNGKVNIFRKQFLAAIKGSSLEKYLVDENINQLTDKKLAGLCNDLKQVCNTQRVLYHHNQVIITDHYVVWGSAQIRDIGSLLEIISLTNSSKLLSFDGVLIKVIDKSRIKEIMCEAEGQDKYLCLAINVALEGVRSKAYSVTFRKINRFCNVCKSNNVEKTLTGVKCQDCGNKDPKTIYMHFWNNIDLNKMNNKVFGKCLVNQVTEKRVICKNCGKEISSNAKFCNFCGKKNIQ